MKKFITLALLFISLSSSAQDWQQLYDSASYSLETGYITHAQKLAKLIPNSKDQKQQYKKYLLLYDIDMEYRHLRTAMQDLDLARTLVNNKSVKLSQADLIDLQLSYCMAYLEMNELEKTDSVLELIKKQAGKSIPQDYYEAKYQVLKKVGKENQAFDFLENEVQPFDRMVYQTLMIEDFIRGKDYALASEELDELLTRQKRTYPKYADELDKRYYPYRIQSASSLAELKTIIRQASWKGKYTTQLDWLELITGKANELHEKNFCDSVALQIIEISSKHLGMHNTYLANAWLTLLNTALQTDDLLKARKYAEKAEAALTALLGDNSVAFRGKMFEVIRYKEVVGYVDEVHTFILKSLERIDMEAGKKHPYYSTYASYYFKNNADRPDGSKYLQEAVKQYNLDDNNCSGCYALVLSNLAKSMEHAGDVRQAEYYYRRAWEKVKVDPEGEIFYRGVLTDFYRRCLALNLRSKLEFFPEEIETKRNDSIFVTYKNGKPGMVYVSDLYKNYDEVIQKSSAAERNDLNYSKAKLAWSENKESEATLAFVQTMNEVIKGLDVLEYLHETEKINYYKSASEPINAFFSFCVSRNTLSTGFLMEAKYVNYIKEKLKSDSTSYEVKQRVLDKKNYYEFTLLHARKALNIRLATKGMVFASSKKVQNRVLSSGDTALIRQYRHLEQLKKELSSVYMADPEKLPKKESIVQQLTQQVNAKDVEMAEKSAAFKETLQNKNVTFEQIQSKLKPGEVAIETIRINHPLYYQSDKMRYADSVYYAFFIIKPEQKLKPEMIVLKNGYDLENKFYKIYKNSIRFQQDDAQSYQHYWGALAARIAGRKKIYFSPDGIYNLISLNTLKNPTGNQYLLEQTDITILPDLKTLVEKNESVGLHQSVILGDPAFSASASPNPKTENNRSFQLANLLGDEIPPLKGTRTEVEAIDQLLKENHWGTTLYTGKEATEDNIKKVHDPTLLHIATHGFFFDRPEQYANPLLLSGLLLAGVNLESKPSEEDGVLTAYEAQGLNLPHTELVILSACETGTGVVTSGDGVYGLQRAFMTAGAQNVIMSLWAVDDAATSLLMRTFYLEWTHGTPKNTALKKAALEVKKQYPSPYYWGAFVMLGY